MIKQEKSVKIERGKILRRNFLLWGQWKCPWGLEQWVLVQPGLAERVPAHGRGFGTRGSLRGPSNPTHCVILNSPEFPTAQSKLLLLLPGRRAQSSVWARPATAGPQLRLRWPWALSLRLGVSATNGSRQKGAVASEQHSFEILPEPVLHVWPKLTEELSNTDACCLGLLLLILSLFSHRRRWYKCLCGAQGFIQTHFRPFSWINRIWVMNLYWGSAATLAGVRILPSIVVLHIIYKLQTAWRQGVNSYDVPNLYLTCITSRHLQSITQKEVHRVLGTY